jgi:LytR cell envelope-related transcriptional attenuator
MDHVYVRKQTADTPWRTAAVVAGGIAAIELFILVILGVAFGAKLTSDHAEQAVINATTAAKVEAAAPPATSTETKKAKTHTNAAPTASLPRGKTSVIVLNGNGTPGAAAATAQQLRHFRYTVAATGNANRTDFARSLVMYRKGYEGEAIRLAHDLHIKRVTPLDGMQLRDLQGAHLALIVGG